MTEMPWVVQTRLAPGQKLRRNPVWGILAVIAGVVMVLLCVVAMQYGLAGYAQVFASLLPYWGIATLATLGLGGAAFATRGAFNIVMGIIAAVMLVLCNPVVSLIVVDNIGNVL